MPYRRKPTKRSRAPTRKPLNQTEKGQVKRIVNRTLNRRLEWNHLDKTVTVSPSYSGAVQGLSEIPQGTTDTTRIGDEARLASIQFRVQCQNADLHNVVRMLIVQWFDDTAPTASDVLSDTGTSYSHLSPYNSDKVGKGKKGRVLYDKSVQLVEPYSGGITSKIFSGIARPKRKMVQFQGGTATGVNKLYAVYISDSAITSHPSMICSFKLWYQG